MHIKTLRKYDAEKKKLIKPLLMMLLRISRARVVAKWCEIIYEGAT